MLDRFIAAMGCTVLALLGFVQPACSQTVYTPLPPIEAVVEQFSDVVLGHEHGLSREVVQKWSVSPIIGVFVEPEFDVTPHLARINGLITEVAKLTGLSVEMGETTRTVTLRIGFYPRSDFFKLPIAQTSADAQKFLSESACVALAMTSSGDTGDIGTGVIVIGTDISASLQRHCLLEELVQVLGLPNDACHYRPSLFCEEDMVSDMTPADRILLKALYDDRVTAGMRRDEAMPIVRQVILGLYERFEASNSLISPLAPRL